MPRALDSLGSRLRALRAAKGLSQAEIAVMVGRHQTAIGPYERDEYEPPREVVERFARVLGTTPEYLYFGRSPRGATVLVAGRIGPGGSVLEVAEPAAPPARMLRLEGLSAYEIQDDTMAPAYRRGQFALIARAPAEPWSALIGGDALVRLPDGREMLRRLLPGRSRQVAVLHAYAAPPLDEVTVTSARAALGVIAPDVLTPETSGT